MASKTNCVINGVPYYRLRKTVGKKINKAGNEEDIIKAFYGKNKKEAEEKYKEYMNKKDMNLDSSKQYFGIMADRWIYNFLINDTSLKESTINLYISTWNKYVKTADLYTLPLNDISAGMIQSFYNDLFRSGCPTSAIKSINKTMSRFYKYLVQNNFVPFNFTASLTIPKVKKEEESIITTWSNEELCAILNSFDKAQNGFRLRFLLVLATYTGMRISELLGVKYTDIKKTQDGYSISVCRQVQTITHYEADGSRRTEIESGSLKSASSYRTIPLNHIVIDELEIHRRWHKKEQMRKGYRTDFIFTTDTGSLIDSHNAKTACNRYYKRIGIDPKGFHTYRHTFGTRLYKNGVPLKTASDLLGHSDISITAKYYIGTGEEEKRKAIETLSIAL